MIYLSIIDEFESSVKKHYSRINASDIQLYLNNYKFTSISQQNQIISSLKFAWEKCLGKKYLKINFKRPRKENKLPIVFTQHEVQRIFDVCVNIKHKVVISLLYGCGLRKSELINLKWEHIDRSAMILNVINAKGNKDRQVDLPENIIPILEMYYREYRCKPYVLSGQKKDKYSGSSIQNVVKSLSKKAGINKRAYTHLIRYCTFTHMAENKIDIGYIQNSAGHSKTDTTRRYIHMSHNLVKNATSPLNNIKI